MTYYKKVKTIQKSLFQNNVPDDLFDIIFDYYGDTEETVDDLHNKHCFYQITCSSVVRNVRGYFCRVCDSFLEVKSVKQLNRHCKCVEHRQNLPDYIKGLNKLSSIPDIQKICGSKWFRGMEKIPKKYIKGFINDLTPIVVVIDFTKNEIRKTNV